MKLVSEYLELCQQFTRLAAAEDNPTAKQQLQDQADAYYKLAAKRAADLKQPVPLQPAAHERT
jgi:hypothetical protein